jgi:hypothetical protein
VVEFFVFLQYKTKRGKHIYASLSLFSSFKNRHFFTKYLKNDKMIKAISVGANVFLKEYDINVDK